PSSESQRSMLPTFTGKSAPRAPSAGSLICGGGVVCIDGAIVCSPSRLCLDWRGPGGCRRRDRMAASGTAHASLTFSAARLVCFLTFSAARAAVSLPLSTVRTAASFPFSATCFTAPAASLMPSLSLVVMLPIVYLLHH